MRAPLFSVIIPTLNEEKFLPRLLASLASQTKKDFEVIVVDGSSKDKTVAGAKRFAKKLPRFRIIINKKASLPLQRNLGAKEAKGKWFVFVDADSVLLPYFFDRVRWFIEEQNPKLFTTWFKPDSDISGDTLITLLANMYIESSILFKRPIAPGPLTIVDRRTFEGVGGYNESLTFGEDYDFTTRVVSSGIPLTIFRETLYVYSLRRIRREGKLKTVQLYVKASLLVLLTKKNLTRVPDYVMGGHLYTGKKPVKRSVLARYERKLRELMEELFS
jgi:glycosyltransferase involved in cell wall biosynthesis